MKEFIWCIAQEIFEGRPGEKLADVLRERGQKVYDFTYNLEDRYYVNENFQNDYGFLDDWDLPLIMAHGPFKFVKQIRNSTPNLLTHFKDNMRCSEYMSQYPLEWFLNSDAYFTTYAMLCQNKPSENIFIRPNSAFKTFTGFEVKVEDFDLEMSSLFQLQNIQNEELILVAKPKVIEGEFRCVVVDNKVVAYSTYRWDDILDIRRDIFPDCLELAERVANHPYKLDVAYVVDVCRTPDGPKIVEFNSLCSSGLYACDVGAIVDSIIALSDKIIQEEYIY